MIDLYERISDFVVCRVADVVNAKRTANGRKFPEVLSDGQLYIQEFFTPMNPPCDAIRETVEEV